MQQQPHSQTALRAVLASGAGKHSRLGARVACIPPPKPTSHSRSLHQCQLSPISACQLPPPGCSTMELRSA
ncbi:hypothetical protein NQZ68_029491 [Dissostichus eleginoides]|nr:hypothetical protein NQZ68_029491 [Dissostichus eleginoides]